MLNLESQLKSLKENSQIFHHSSRFCLPWLVDPYQTQSYYATAF